jgi:hypothetical protein
MTTQLLKLPIKLGRKGSLLKSDIVHALLLFALFLK